MPETDLSSKTDSTRAKDFELKVQARVNSELSRIREYQERDLANLTKSLTTGSPEDSPQKEAAHNSDGLLATLSSPFSQDHRASSQPKQEKDQSREGVQKEIMELRKKLDSRKKTEKPSPKVEQAKSKLATCLRANDRRPLDCWQEVEAFKNEVGKLEEVFIAKVGR